MSDELVAFLWEREDADVVAARLDGQVRRGRFHGEDDDEDHPWVVVLPAAADRAVLGELLDEYDGWLEPVADDPAPAPPTLPTGPRRLKRTPPA